MRRPAASAQNLARSLAFGALYDGVLAIAILAAGDPLMQFLRFPRPESLFLFRLSAMPPLLFPIVYISAARDPLGRPWAVRASILLRGAGGLLLGTLVLFYRPPGGHVYATAAALDIAWGVVHAVLWSRVKPRR